jgi:hypothetical protein
MYAFGKRELLRMEELPARLALDLIWSIAENVLYAVRAELDTSIEAQICFGSASVT